MSKQTNPDSEASLSCGFYNALNHDRLYDATEMSMLFDGVLNDGVFANVGDCFVVRADTGYFVTVGTGRAWFNHTWTYNDSPLEVNVGPPELVYNRIDAIVLEVNSNENVRDNFIKVIKGEPGTRPERPALENSEFVHQHVLCYIMRTANTEEILQSNITNMVGTDSTPFITGILQVVSLNQLVGQWEGELNEFVETETASFMQWFEHVQDILTEDVAGELIRRMAACEDTIEGFREQIANLYFSVDETTHTLRITYDDGT